MLYILLSTIIVLQIIFYIKLKNKIEIETIKQHNGILLEIKNLAFEIYRDMTKTGLSKFDTESEDELYEQVKEIVILEGKVSTSWVQRKFGISYSRAVCLINALEQDEVIGPANGSTAREVYADKSKE